MTGIDKSLFENDHYLGKPANEEDRIITRRIRILEKYGVFFNKESHLIEVGCGSGITVTRLANRFTTCLGIDVYDYSTEFQRNKELNQADNCSFRQVDLENEQVPGNFQRLISFEVIEHFRNESTVRKFSDMLEEGGLAAISVPNKWWIFETHGARLPLLPWNRVPFFSWLPRFIHERYANARIYTSKRIRKLLIENGFEIINMEYITAPMDVLKESPLKRWLIKNIFKGDTTRNPFLSTSIFVLARKK